MKEKIVLICLILGLALCVYVGSEFWQPRAHYLNAYTFNQWNGYTIGVGTGNVGTWNGYTFGEALPQLITPYEDKETKEAKNSSKNTEKKEW